MPEYHVRPGLLRLATESACQQSIKGNIGYLCHGPSVLPNYEHGAAVLKRLFGPRLKALFSPQHGLAGADQDNMIESPHYFHPHYQIPVYSLYSETRAPTPAMLAGLDTLIIDLQDCGARVFTYIWTMTLAMAACAQEGVGVVILDRPNPLGGVVVEGNTSELSFRSLIGWWPLPMRHGLTAGEIARKAVQEWGIACDLQVISLENWKREHYFDETGLPWVQPSPNLPTLDTALVYPGMVLFEGTNLSEGRGTTRPFELIGHPKLDAFALVDWMEGVQREQNLAGFVLRPTSFVPTFDKHVDAVCHGIQIHVTDRRVFRPWATGQWLLKGAYQLLGTEFSWRQPPFEYVDHLLPIDLLNGTDRFRLSIAEPALAT